MSNPATDNTPKNDALASMRISEFRYFMLARFFFIMGLRMVATAVGWEMYIITRNPFALGMIGLAEVIPAISLALYAGHVIDRTDRRGMLLKTILFYLFCIIALGVITSGYMKSNLSSKHIEYTIYFIIFLTGIIRAFAGPASFALLPQIVPKELFTNAISWSTGTWQTAAVIGPSITGFLIAYIGITPTFSIITIFTIIAAFSVYKIGKKPVSNITAGQRTWKSVKEGLKFVYRTKEVLGALTLDLFAVFFGGAVALLPIYATDILKVGAQGLGLLNAAPAVGSILVILYLTIKPLKHSQGKVLMLCVGGFGAFIILFGISTWFWISMLALLASGILDGVSVVVRSTILQLKTPDEMRGRVSSVNSMFINSSNELGQFESGFTAKIMGVVPAVVFGGCMTIGISIFTWFKAPGLKKLNL